MALFKNSVGRPSNEILKKRKIVIACIILTIIIAICCCTFILTNSLSTKKLVGTARESSKPASCSIEVYDIKATTATMYYKCTKGQVKSATIYDSNKNGKAVKKRNTLQSRLNIIKYGVVSGIYIKKLKPNSYYLVSIKMNDGKVKNKLFKTNANDKMAAKNPFKSYIDSIKVTEQTKNSLTFYWTAMNGGINNFKLYEINSNDIITKTVKTVIPRVDLQYGGWKIDKLDTYNKSYLLYVKFTDDKICYYTKTKKVYHNCNINDNKKNKKPKVVSKIAETASNAIKSWNEYWYCVKNYGECQANKIFDELAY